MRSGRGLLRCPFQLTNRDGLRRRGRTVAVECKASSAPAVTRGNTLALGDIRPDRAFVAAPVAASYALSSVWTVLAPADLPAVFDESFAP